jgi:hypothetical protein
MDLDALPVHREGSDILDAIELAGFRPLAGAGAVRVAAKVAGVASELGGPDAAKIRLEILSRLVASTRMEVALLETLQRSLAASTDQASALKVAHGLDLATRRLLRLLAAHADEERRQPGRPRLLVTVAAPPGLRP